jgi:hypothetical protein
MRCKFAAKPGKIESSVDLPRQMIFGNCVAKMKLVEQLTLVTLQTAVCTENSNADVMMVKPTEDRV